MGFEELNKEELLRLFRRNPRGQQLRPITFEELVGTYAFPDDLPIYLKRIYDRRKEAGRPLLTKSEKGEACNP